MSADEIEWVYNALDCGVTYEVHDSQLKDLDNVAGNTAGFSHSLMAPVFDMTLRGIAIDLDARMAAIKEFENKHRVVRVNTVRIVEEGVGLKPFNPGSNKDVNFLFYKVMGLKPIKARNAHGIWVPTVNRDAMEKLQKYWSAGPICRHILTMREVKKKLDFVQSPLDSDGRYRASYNIAGTNEGRFSSTASDYGTGNNAQNIDRTLRKMFVPDPGMKFCNIDLEQADSRNVGAMCHELFITDHGEGFADSYLNACESADLHTTVAKMVWRELDWPGDASGDRKLANQIFYRNFSRRDQTKRLGHGTNFYGLPITMALNTRIEKALVEEFQQRYFEAFPCIGSYDRKADKDNWHTWTRKQIAEFGSIITPYYNRRRAFWGRPEDDRTLREGLAYTAAAMTADAINTGLLRLWRLHRPDIHLLAQVHDSILVQFPEEAEDEIVPFLLATLKVEWMLKGDRPFHIPLEAKVGWNWGDYNDDEEKGELNLSGLRKWTGEPDNRQRPIHRLGSARRSLRELLNAT